jgi:hypothetical protein
MKVSAAGVIEDNRVPTDGAERSRRTVHAAWH